MLPLKYPWTLWIHPVKSNDWSRGSYKKVYKMDSVESFWRVYNNVPNMLEYCFFLMKDDIFPEWKEKENINGSRWSFIIQKENVDEAWLELSMALIGNYLLSDKDYERINGIEIQFYPKSSTIKIWSNDTNDKLTFEHNVPYIDMDYVKFVTNKSSRYKDAKKKTYYKKKPRVI